MNKYIISLFSVAILVVAIVISWNRPQVTEASVPWGGEYQSTTTNSLSGFTTYMVKSGSGVLGSIVIASTSGSYAVPGANGAGMFALYDAFAATATSTASSTLIRVAPGTAAGTYTLDSIVTKGLVIDIPKDFNGSYTVTFR